MRLGLPTPGLVGSPHVHSSCLASVVFAFFLTNASTRMPPWAFTQLALCDFRLLCGSSSTGIGVPIFAWGYSRSPPAASVLAFVPLDCRPSSSPMCSTVLSPCRRSVLFFGHSHPGTPGLQARFFSHLCSYACGSLQALRLIAHAIFQYDVLYMNLARLCC